MARRSSGLGPSAEVLLLIKGLYVSRARRLAQELADARTVIEAAIQQPDKALVFLRPGRLVRIREGAVDWGWGIVCSVSRRPGGAADGLAAPASHYMLDTLLATAAGSMKGACCDAHLH